MNNYNVAQRINSQVNASVTYKTDLAQFEVPEFWQEAGKFGDCEDYALLKRKMLIDAGFDRDKCLFLLKNKKYYISKLT